jgi:hypothetical protein
MKHPKPNAVVESAHVSRKITTAIKKPKGEIVDHDTAPRSLTHIEDLRTQLNYFLAPDFAEGDYWPRLDRRLYGLLPDLIARTLDSLDAAYPSKKKSVAQRDTNVHA